MIELTDHQQEEIGKVKEWFGDKKSKVFMCFGGLAGTGKTTIIKNIEEQLGLEKGDSSFASYTGKAVDVMKRKELDASTIHGLMYEPIIEDNVLIGFENTGLNPNLKLIVVDEASMVPKDIHEDLCEEAKFIGAKILYVGDYGQLPPVSTDKFNLMGKDMLGATLYKIHRQAKGSGILRMSALARSGKSIMYQSYGNNEEAFKIDKVTKDQIVNADQVV